LEEQSFNANTNKNRIGNLPPSLMNLDGSLNKGSGKSKMIASLFGIKPPSIFPLVATPIDNPTERDC
jgi:hypothetical protein